MNPDGPYGALVAWAEEYAERIDPLTPMREEAERVQAEETRGPAPSYPSGSRSRPMVPTTALKRTLYAFLRVHQVHRQPDAGAARIHRDQLCRCWVHA